MASRRTASGNLNWVLLMILLSFFQLLDKLTYVFVFYVYSLTLSDGVHYMPAMLTTQLNGMVTSKEIDKLCIIRVERYLCNTVRDKKYVLNVYNTILFSLVH